MNNDCKIPCHHSEDVVQSKTRLDKVEERQREESKKQEDYRVAVHGRINETQNMVNLLRMDAFKTINTVDKKVDHLDHITQNQSELISEFKLFIGEATKTFTSIKNYMTKQEAKSTLKVKIVEYIIKLAGFSVAIIAIVNYIKGV